MLPHRMTTATARLIDRIDPLLAGPQDHEPAKTTAAETAASRGHVQEGRADVDVVRRAAREQQAVMPLTTMPTRATHDHDRLRRSPRDGSAGGSPPRRSRRPPPAGTSALVSAARIEAFLSP